MSMVGMGLSRVVEKSSTEEAAPPACGSGIADTIREGSISSHLGT